MAKDYDEMKLEPIDGRGMELDMMPMADMELELEALGVTPAQYAALDGRVQANTDAIGALDNRVDEAETTVSDITTELTTARNGETSLDERLDGIDAQLADIENGEGINDGAIKPENLNKSAVELISADLSIGNRIPDFYTRSSDGRVVGYPNTTTGGTTEPIEVSAGEKIEYVGYTTSDNIGVVYDENNVKISALTPPLTDNSSRIMIMPEGAAYIRVNYAYSTESQFYVKKYYLEKYQLDWLEVDDKHIKNESIGLDKLTAEAKNEIFDNVVKLKYGHALTKPFAFTGKTITFFGDSIAAGVTSPALAITPNTFCKIFSDKFSMIFGSKGSSGAKICDTINVNSVLNRILGYTTPRDFIVIAGGTNDWTFGSPLGSLGDTTGETFYGALTVICEHLKTTNPNATVIFITPINQNVPRAGVITTMDAYRNAIFEVATKYGFNVVDGSQIGFPKEQGAFADLMCTDGVHPTELGHSFYAKSLMGILA